MSVPSETAIPGSLSASPTQKTPIVEPRTKCALVWNDVQVSYQDLLRHVYARTPQMPKAGSRVVVFSENSLHWIYAAYAIWAVGAILVPVDAKSTAEEFSYVLDDCEPTLVLCSRDLRPLFERSLNLSSHRPRVLLLEDLTDSESSELAVDRATGKDVPACEPIAVDANALAAIVYTSGTTGDPKGVMLSFGNLLANVRPVVDAGYFTHEARVLLLLPLHHVLPLAGSLIAPLYGGSTVVIATSLAGEALLATMQRHAITTLVGVPRFYDLLHRNLRERINASPAARSLFVWARRLRSHAASRVVFRSVHRKFGGALRHLICGGAALSPDTAETFDVLGFQICEGFGMTECAPMIAFPRPNRIRLGSCGQALDGCEIRIADNGEILTRGPNVMLGYYNRPEETQAILRDGWLHTGDLGRLDEHGYLYVTGRLKEILVLGSGKKVNPATIEAALVAAPAVRDSGVFLEGDALHAIILPNWDRLPRTGRSAGEALLRREVIEPYNSTVAPYRRIARVTLVDDELPRTRLGKLRRHLLSGIAERAARATNPSSVPDAPSQGAALLISEYLAVHTGRPVKTSSHLSFDLGLDSLGRVELSVFIQNTFGFQIPEEKLVKLETIDALGRYVEEHKLTTAEVVPTVSWGEILCPKSPPQLPKSSWRHQAIVYLSRFLVRTLFRISAHGAARLPHQPCIIVPNHQSYLDGLLVCAFMPPKSVLATLFFAKERHVRRAFLRSLADNCNTIVMNPTGGVLGSLQQLAAGLRRGNNVIIFPEGTRSRDGKLGPFRDSYAILAKELGIPVAPVVIDGAHAVLATGQLVPRFFRRIKLTFLDAIHPLAGETAAELNQRVRALVAEALDRRPKPE